MNIYTKNIPIRATYDVIVLGSGSAGAVAALAAARNGARTLLLERLPFVGGTSTAVLDTFYGFYTPGTKSIKVVGGIADDVMTRLKGYAALLERPNTHGAGTGVTYHPEYLKVVWESLLAEAGVDILLNAWVQDVLTEGDRPDTLVTATKMGLAGFRAKFFVDASGDADLCHFAGIPYELAGDIDPAQTLTTTFKLCNVDVVRRKTVGKAEFHALMAEAAESGQYQLPRKEGSDHITPVDHMTATIMTRLPSFRRDGDRVVNATDPDLLSSAEIEGRRQAIEYIRFLRDKVPGYEKAQLSTFGAQIGVRETRRVYGEYRINREDVLTARKFDDQIALCGAPIEDHHGGADTAWAYLPDGDCCGIPLGTLIPKDSRNVIVAGRCFSATHDAHASIRSMAQCMAQGQAAGTVATMASKSGRPAQELPFAAVRDQLLDDGAILQMP